MAATSSNYSDRDFSILRVDGNKVADTSKHFKVPGQRGSVRMSPHRRTLISFTARHARDGFRRGHCVPGRRNNSATPDVFQNVILATAKHS